MRAVWTAAAAVAALVIAACGTGPPPEVPAGPDGSVDVVLEEGREIYGAECASCHGRSGGGGRGPQLGDGRLTERFPNLDDAATVVTEGGNGMPAFGDDLTPEQIDAVLRYVRDVL